MQSTQAPALIQAQSDDTIGTYGGQIQGAQNAAVGATVTVSEKRGITQTEILNSDIVRSAQETSSVLTTKAGVDENAINSNIVNDVSLAASLRDARQDKTFSGLMVDASSTETFKTFYITEEEPRMPRSQPQETSIILVERQKRRFSPRI